ncbi:glycerophosphodiester phosphodiesterase family protein [Thalassotalea sp. SU-HH00458]|uniref:glycerophosphodiester phosphodiesterase n=1 Tax=Thalassotalea sp. SU-HH00458 TaxID=3127657 RepID=UPI003108CEA3
MKIIAHRGASGEFPENSILAFEQAILQEADGIELDVHFHSPSQQFIVLHDQYLDEITNAKGQINQYSLEQLTQLSLGQEQKLITLSQALTTIAGRTLVNIEIKSACSDISIVNLHLSALKSQINYAIKHLGFSSQQFVLSSFNHHIIKQSKLILPDIETAALIAHNPIEYASFAQKLKCLAINPAIECLEQALVTNAQQLGLKVWVYTVDREEDINFCRQINVDAIFTNFPKKVRDYINNCNDS